MLPEPERVPLLPPQAPGCTGSQQTHPPPSQPGQQAPAPVLAQAAQNKTGLEVGGHRPGWTVNPINRVSEATHNGRFPEEKGQDGSLLPTPHPSTVWVRDDSLNARQEAPPAPGGTIVFSGSVCPPSVWLLNSQPATSPLGSPGPETKAQFPQDSLPDRALPASAPRCVVSRHCEG